MTKQRMRYDLATRSGTVHGDPAYLSIRFFKPVSGRSRSIDPTPIPCLRLSRKPRGSEKRLARIGEHVKTLPFGAARIWHSLVVLFFTLLYLTSGTNLAAQGATATVLSVQFVGSGTPMGSAEVAGVVAKNNWNNARGARNSTPLALADETGIATSASITWTSDDAWYSSSVPDQAGNLRMMRGYLDNGQMNTTTVTLSGLPANSNGYSVYVYANGASNNSSNTGIYQISGAGITTTSATLTYNSNFSGTFTQATASNPIGNYVVLTIPNVSSFTLSAIPSTASNGYKRAPVNGIQIVPISSSAPDFTISPSPATQSVSQGKSTTYTVSTAALNGFTGTVNLSVTSALPTGATASFNPTTIATNPSTPVGSSTLTITGTSGSLVHSANAILNVTSSISSASAISIDFVG